MASIRSSRTGGRRKNWTPEEEAAALAEIGAEELERQMIAMRIAEEHEKARILEINQARAEMERRVRDRILFGDREMLLANLSARRIQHEQANSSEVIASQAVRVIQGLKPALRVRGGAETLKGQYGWTIIYKKMYSGPYWRTLQARNRKDPSQLIALTIIDLQKAPKEKRENLEKNGYRILYWLAQNPHPNLVKVYDQYLIDSDYYCFHELMPHNLEHLLSHHHSASEFRAAKWGLQIARGIDYLHSHGICHRNICPGTVWLNGALHCKLGNFSYAAIYYDVTKGQFVNVGKCHNKKAEYHPPEESFFSTNYDPVKVDVWMWAATVVYMLCKKFPSKNILGVQDFTNFRDTHIAILSDDGRDLLATCLNKDPGQRPTMSAVIHDIWFKEFIQPHNHQAQQVGTQVVTTPSGHIAVIHHDADSSGSVVSPTSTDSSGSVSS